MIPTAISLVGAVVLSLDAFAIAGVLMGSSAVQRETVWIMVIPSLPLLGMLLYYLIGRNASDARAG
jgi:hypothetical protein